MAEQIMQEATSKRFTLKTAARWYRVSVEIAFAGGKVYIRAIDALVDTEVHHVG
jgi:hypothetical protein